MQSEGRLYLVFEFVDRDLKKYMEAQPDMLPRAQVKVRPVFDGDRDGRCTALGGPAPSIYRKN